MKAAFSLSTSMGARESKAASLPRLTEAGAAASAAVEAKAPLAPRPPRPGNAWIQACGGRSVQHYTRRHIEPASFCSILHPFTADDR